MVRSGRKGRRDVHIVGCRISDLFRPAQVYGLHSRISGSDFPHRFGVRLHHAADYKSRDRGQYGNGHDSADGWHGENAWLVEFEHRAPLEALSRDDNADLALKFKYSWLPTKIKTWE
jgi:hypothetical protein